MDIKGWKYYNHSAIPTTAPHEVPDLSSVEDGSIWSIGGGKPFLVRWTDNYDCGYKTNWWYVIRENPFNLSELNAKHRYEVNKGIKNFDVKVIEPKRFEEELFFVTKAAFESWPKKYRPLLDESKWDVSSWDEKYKVYGAFSKDDNTLQGYACLKINCDNINFTMLRVNPEKEKLAINAALVYGLLIDNGENLKQGVYICDGARSISHETAFQDYLEKYFNFRKAYCNVHVLYNPKIKKLIPILFLFRKIFKRLDNIGIFHKVNGLLKMEEIIKEQV